MQAKTILLVDDDQSVLDGLRRALRREKYQILTAGSGEEALGILGQNSINVIVSDEKMPGMSGTQFLSLVRNKYPDIIRIILTGHANIESAMNAIYDGWVYQYLHKPVDTTDLASTIYNGILMQSLRSNSESPSMVMDATEQDSLLASFASEKTDQNDDTQKTVVETFDLLAKEIRLLLSRSEPENAETIVRDLESVIVGHMNETIVDEFNLE